MQPIKIESLRIGEMLDTSRTVGRARSYPFVYYVEARVRGEPTPLNRHGDITTFAVAAGGDRAATFDSYSEAQAFLRKCAAMFGVSCASAPGQPDRACDTQKETAG